MIFSSAIVFAGGRGISVPDLIGATVATEPLFLPLKALLRPPAPLRQFPGISLRGEILCLPNRSESLNGPGGQRYEEPSAMPNLFGHYRGRVSSTQSKIRRAERRSKRFRTFSTRRSTTKERNLRPAQRKSQHARPNPQRKRFRSRVFRPHANVPHPPQTRFIPPQADTSAPVAHMRRFYYL